MISRISLKLERVIADHATSSELGGFHAQFPITFYMLQGSNHFLHSTGIHLVNREVPPSRGLPEKQDVQLRQALVRALPELSSRFERQNVRLDLLAIHRTRVCRDRATIIQVFAVFPKEIRISVYHKFQN